MITAVTSAESGDRFTRTALAALGEARKLATRLGRREICAMCIVFGLLVVPASLAGQVLGAFGLTAMQVEMTLGGQRRVETTIPTKMPFDRTALRALEIADVAAEYYGHGAVATAHLLVGLLAAHKGKGAETILELMSPEGPSIHALVSALRTARLNAAYSGHPET